VLLVVLGQHPQRRERRNREREHDRVVLEPADPVDPLDRQRAKRVLRTRLTDSGTPFRSRPRYSVASPAAASMGPPSSRWAPVRSAS
jgi:hypothetical protein